jgi:hypothetical protein
MRFVRHAGLTVAEGQLRVQSEMPTDTGEHFVIPLARALCSRKLRFQEPH